MNSRVSQPPYTLSPATLGLVADIAEAIGRSTIRAEQQLSPRLRRDNRLRTIQASLAIEHNSLSLAQVTAVIEGRRVLGDPREIREVRNAFAAYERLEHWQASSVDDLLTAHGLLMAGLLDDAGRFRSGGVGIYRGEEIVHLGPPAHLVPTHVTDLFRWLAHTEEHPLVAGCVVHYELEFVHPFTDGNGRLGRLWHTLILRAWRPVLAYLPVEAVIRDRQEGYCRALAEADQRADSGPFIFFMLQALRDALHEAEELMAGAGTDQGGDQVSDQVARLLAALADGPLSSSQLLAERTKLSHREHL